MKIYHNPRCKKSRAGLEYLKTKGIEFEVIEYLKTPLTEDELAHILMLMNKKAFEIVRTQEDVYKKELKGKNFTEEEWIKIIVRNPKLLQRPIVTTKSKGVIAQPPENIDTIL